MAQPTEVVEPCEEALHLPAAYVSAKGAAVLGEALAVRAMGCNQLDSSFLGDLHVERVAIVCLVANEPRLGLGEEAELGFAAKT